MTRARRTPRASESTPWAEERSILRHDPFVQLRDGTIKDNCPNLLLTNATVFNKKGDQMVNALFVKTDGLAVARGNLVIEETDDRVHLINRIRGPKPIQVSEVSQYSLQENGAIWVRGECAWYRLKPSPEYRPLYDEMYQGLELFFALEQTYVDLPGRRNKDSSLGLDEIFFRVAVNIGDGSMLEEIQDRFRYHGRFIKGHLTTIENIGEDHGRKWKHTQIFRWLETEAKKPQASDRKNSKSAGRSSFPTAEMPSRPLRNSRPVSSSPSVPAEGQDRTRSRSLRSASVGESWRQKAPLPVPKKQNISPTRAVQDDSFPISNTTSIPPASLAVSSPDATADNAGLPAFIKAFEDYDEFHSNPKLDSVRFSNLWQDYSWPTYKDDSRGSHRKPIEEILHHYAKDLVDSLDRTKFGHQEIYQWLQEVAKKPWEPVITRASDYPWRLTRRKKAQKVSKDKPSTPKPSTPQTPFPQRSGKALGRKTGQKSVLRPAKRSIDDVEDVATPTMAKRSHYFSGDDEDEDDDSSSSSHSDSGGPEDPIPIILQAEKIPSSVVRGPDDTWTCEEDGCSHIVRASDAGECQRLIAHHFSEHKQQTSRLDLAVAESRGHMPINHLLEKIKALGAAKQPNGVQPIKKKLIV